MPVACGSAPPPIPHLNSRRPGRACIDPSRRHLLQKLLCARARLSQIIRFPRTLSARRRKCARASSRARAGIHREPSASGGFPHRVSD
eukprot:2602773-Pyramimonas_sp.AAC.1